MTNEALIWADALSPTGGTRPSDCSDGQRFLQLERQMVNGRRSSQRMRSNFTPIAGHRPTGESYGRLGDHRAT